MAVAMDAQPPHVTGTIECGRDPVEDVVSDTAVSVDQVVRDEIPVEQSCHRGMSVMVHGQLRAGRERPCCPAGVEAAEQPAEQPASFRVIEVDQAATTTREQGEAPPVVSGQGVCGSAIAVQRRHDWQVMFHQLSRERVLLEDCRIAPAPRAVELGDHRQRILEADLVDAVLVAVEGQQLAAAAPASGLDGIEYGFRGQSRKWGVGRVQVGHAGLRQ